jgi:PAS domain S-box-containing protein
MTSSVFQSDQHSTNILVVDDHAGVRASLKDLVSSRAGWIVCGEAANGIEAVSLALELKPSAIVMDISMPVLDGLEATRRIREKLPNVEVVIVSQHDASQVVSEAQKAGARGFVLKSQMAADLVPALESALLHLSRISSSDLPPLPRSAAQQPVAVSLNRTEFHSELLAAIVASSDDAIVSKSLDGIITSWNHSAERIFGYTAEEAIGQPITLIIPSSRWEEEVDILSRLRRGQRVDHFETVRKRKDGVLLNVSLTISPVRDGTGKIIGASKVARDITAQKRAEERERRITQQAIAANAKFRAVFEQTTVFAGIMNKDGVLIEANRLSLDACGHDADDALDKPFWEGPWWRNHPESQNKIRAAIPMVAQGTPYREMLPYSWADGTERLLDFALYPIVDDLGLVLFLHPTGVDITDIKRTEENYRKLTESLEAEVLARTRELEERNAELLRQSEQVRELSWRLLRIQEEERRHIARELHDSAGQTLAVLALNVSKIVNDAKDQAPGLLQTAEETQEIVQQLTQELRTTSYLLHPPLLDENGLRSAISWYVQGLIERSGLQIELDIPKDFGRLPQDMELVVFRMVQECLTNVHRHSGSKTARIRVWRDAEHICVEIQDQGQGMSPERLAEIQSRGTGVGIRGMRERLRQFAGQLSIESDPSGTRIRVIIPIVTTAVTAKDPGNVEPLGVSLSSSP